MNRTKKLGRSPSADWAAVSLDSFVSLILLMLMLMSMLLLFWFLLMLLLLLFWWQAMRMLSLLRLLSALSFSWSHSSSTSDRRLSLENWTFLMHALGNRLSLAFTAEGGAAGAIGGLLLVVVAVAVAAITLELSVSRDKENKVRVSRGQKSYTHNELIKLGYQLGVRFVCPSSVSV